MNILLIWDTDKFFRIVGEAIESCLPILNLLTKKLFTGDFLAHLKEDALLCPLCRLLRVQSEISVKKFLTAVKVAE